MFVMRVHNPLSPSVVTQKAWSSSRPLMDQSARQIPRRARIVVVLPRHRKLSCTGSSIFTYWRFYCSLCPSNEWDEDVVHSHICSLLCGYRWYGDDGTFDFIQFLMQSNTQPQKCGMSCALCANKKKEKFSAMGMTTSSSTFVRCQRFVFHVVQNESEAFGIEIQHISAVCVLFQRAFCPEQRIQMGIGDEREGTWGFRNFWRWCWRCADYIPIPILVPVHLHYKSCVSTVSRVC